MADVEKLKFGTTTYDLRDAGAARDNGVVHIAGAETVTGAKTFSNNTTILNSGANTGYIGLNLSSSGSSISLKKQSGSDTVTPVNITANSLSQYYGTSQTPYVIQLGTQGTSTDKVKISSAGSITINGNEVVTTNDSRLSNARTPSNDSNLVHKTGNETIGGIKTFNDDIIINDSNDNNRKSIKFITSESSVPQIQAYGNSLNFENADDYNFDGEVYIDNNVHIHDGDLYTTGAIYTDNIQPYNAGDILYINAETCIEDSLEVEGSLTTNGITTSDSISIDAPGADILIPTNATDGNIAIAPAFSTSKAYAVGDYVIYNNEVYKCTTAHSASAWNYSHFSDITNKIVSVDDIIGKTFEATGSDYAEKFETLEDCPACRFVTLDGEKIKLAQPEDDYILGITSELPSIIGDKMNQGTPVGLLGKLWVECDDTVKVNSFVTSGKDGIATKSDKGYRVMAVDGNKCKVLVK